MGDQQQGLNAAAFGELASAMLRPALGVANRLLRSRACAEDAVQEAFVRAIRNYRSYDPAKPFSPWYYAILRNVCQDMQRRRQRHERAVRDLMQQTVSSVDVRENYTVDVMQMMSRLPAPESDVLVLRIVEGLAFADVAAAMGISEEAAKKRAQRGLERLRGLCAAPDAAHGDGHIPGRCPAGTPSHVQTVETR